jgi:uncharacterized protein (TIGR02145 family)
MIKYFYLLAIFFVPFCQIYICQSSASETIYYLKEQSNSFNSVLHSASLHSDSIQVKSGWNLISLPLIFSDSTTNYLFPSAISDAFIYGGSYQPVESLKTGTGFWLKFDSSETIYIEGEPFNQHIIDVNKGWNLIGAPSSSALSDSISSYPLSIIVSDFYGYIPNDGYQAADTLQPGSGYWVKVDNDGTLFIKSIDIACPGMMTVEYGGKIYNTVQIGDKCWLRENLDIGSMISGSAIQTDNDAIEKYCYGNVPANCTLYGGLYEWDEAMQYATSLHSQGICPGGWRIPTPSEFAALGSDGNALKAIGQGSESGAGTNKTGFSALLAGSRMTDGEFSALTSYAYFWTDSMAYGDDRLFYFLGYNSDLALYNYTDKAKGFSVRCVKGPETGNRAPDVPDNPYPSDTAIGISTTVTLTWTCSDPDNDPLRYDIYFGNDNPPVAIVSSDQENSGFHIFDLSPNTKYYWKIIARDNYDNETSGPVWKFTTSESGGGVPCPGLDTVYYEGKTYHTVQIGSQCWLKENLNVGTRINGSSNQSDNSIIEKYCYNDSIENCDIYGGLYQWNEAMQYTTTPAFRGICPDGWHIPTNAEFEILSTSVGANSNSLKAIGQGSGSGAGTNTSGFSAFLAGYRAGNGSFNLLNVNTHFFGSNEYDSANVGIMGCVYSDNVIYLHNYFKDHGFSVRCIKD